MEQNNQPMQQIPERGEQIRFVSSKEFAAKYRSKREIYNFLACDVGIFLPPYDNTTIYFLKELMNGQKKMLRTTMIRTIHIPQYEGLSVLDIRKYLDLNHTNVYAYLPEPQIELPKTPKQWIANVCATVIGEAFNSWVKQQIEIRHGKVTVQKNLLIQMDSDMHEIFQSSIAVNTSKGSSAQLLQSESKRKRTKQQIKDEKEADIEKQQQIAAKLNQYEVLQEKVRMMERNNQDGAQAMNLLQQFCETGFVVQDEEGSFSIPGLSESKKFKPFEEQK